MKIQLLRRFIQRVPDRRELIISNAGDIISIDDAEARQLVTDGVAVVIDDEPEPIAEPKPKRAVKVV